jgi:hypothetical protein
MTDKREGERVIERLWKHRRAPPAPIAEAAAAHQVLTPANRTPVNRWVAAQIVTWSPDNCFHCRRPIVYGAKWVELVNDNDRVRFHSDCAPAWRAQLELAARRALGLDRNRCAQQDPDAVCAIVPQ